MIPNLKTARERLLNLVTKLSQEKLFLKFVSQNNTILLNNYTRLIWELKENQLTMSIDVLDRTIESTDNHPALVQLVLEDIVQSYQEFLEERMKAYQSYIRNRDTRQVPSFEDW